MEDIPGNQKLPQFRQSWLQSPDKVISPATHCPLPLPSHTQNKKETQFVISQLKARISVLRLQNQLKQNSLVSKFVLHKYFFQNFH